MPDQDALNLAYRRAYEAAHAALWRRWESRAPGRPADGPPSAAEVVAELRHDAERTPDPRTAEAIRSGVKDAAARRRPRW
jgi:hypothetical protein